MSFVSTEVLVALLDCNTKLEILLVGDKLLLLEDMWLGKVFVDPLFEVLVLFGNLAIGIGHELNVVFLLGEVEANILIDVGWQRIRELGQAHILHRVVLAAEHDQVLLDDVLSKAVFRKHATDGINKNSLRILLLNGLEGELFETSWVARVMPIQLLLLLAPSEQRVRHVHHNAFVSIMVLRGDVSWLVFASNVLGDEDSHPAHRHSARVE